MHCSDGQICGVACWEFPPFLRRFSFASLLLKALSLLPPFSLLPSPLSILYFSVSVYNLFMWHDCFVQCLGHPSSRPPPLITSTTTHKQVLSTCKCYVVFSNCYLITLLVHHPSPPKRRTYSFSSSRRGSTETCKVLWGCSRSKWPFNPQRCSGNRTGGLRFPLPSSL